MKRINLSLLLSPVSLVFGLLVLSLPATCQEITKNASLQLPDEIYKIVNVSCIPCHTSEGGVMSRSKLNITEWAKYSPEKQKEKAAKMYSEINKGAMPPKKARENNPEKIPTKEQAEIIKKWSESFAADKK
jgi:mono/diheme cytochrome c family protein